MTCRRACRKILEPFSGHHGQARGVLLANEQIGEGTAKDLRHLQLGKRAALVAHRCRAIQHEHRVEVGLVLEALDVILVELSERLPVEVANLVARGVLLVLRELDALALVRTLVQPGQHAVHHRARAVVDGVLSGLHKSPHQGQSVEFAEHKEYAPGDEIRHLDWKAFGKFDKYYIKRFEHETNLHAVLVLDGSGSMGYQSGALSKLEVAKILCGALAYLLVRQQDAAGLAVVTGEGFKDLPARAAAGHLRLVLDEVEGVAPLGTTDLFRAADHLAERISRRSFVAVFCVLFEVRQGAVVKVLHRVGSTNDI